MAVADSVVCQRLSKVKQELLDLSLRNRLLNTPRRAKARNVEIVEEHSDDVFRILATDRKAMTFLPRATAPSAAEGPVPSDVEGRATAPSDVEGPVPSDVEGPVPSAAEGRPGVPSDVEGGAPSAAEAGKNGDEPEALLSQPDESEAGSRERLSDDRLQTALASDQLQKRLLGLFFDARTFEEEQGVNVLYLAMGFLRWYETDASPEPRHAPLLLIPVELSRTTARTRFRLRARDEEVATNLSLQAKLAADFGLQLPSVDESEDFSPAKYFAQVKTCIESKSRWEILPNDMLLWFFSFTKFLMYRDLDPATWPAADALAGRPLIRGLLADGFQPLAPLCGDDDPLDPLLKPLELTHIVDADSSQTQAIEEVRRGQNLVIQGPPGTGKSQTIANLIATAVKSGKKVLFVAEKMAALDVVKRRLDNINLGDICLELHSYKANKRTVLEELQRTLELGQPKAEPIAQQAEALLRLRDRLDGHVDDLYCNLGASGLTAYAVLGQLCRLRASGVRPADFDVSGALEWSPAQFHERLNLVGDVASHIKDIGIPNRHAWRGVGLAACLPTTLDRVRQRLPDLIERIGSIATAAAAVARALEQSPPESAEQIAAQGRLARALAQAPDMDRSAIAGDVWQQRRAEITEAVGAVSNLEHSAATLNGAISPQAWSTDMSGPRRAIAMHGRSWLRIFSGEYRAAIRSLRGILKIDLPKDLKHRLKLLDALAEWQQAHRDVENTYAELGQLAFGDKWRGLKSDWGTLQRIDEWEAQGRAAGLPANFRQALVKVAEPQKVVEQVKPLAADLRKLLADLAALFDDLALDRERAFGAADIGLAPLGELKQRLEAWLADPEGISKWTVFRARWALLDQAGLGQLAGQLYDGRLAAGEAGDRLSLNYYERLLAAALAERPALAAFDGNSHDQVRGRFQQEDRRRIELTRVEVALAHYRGIPTTTGGLGELGILKHEMNKKRNHKPLRKLISEAGRAIQAIKPVFMMSPMSVAQYLEPGSTEFDLLLFDEASQVRPEDALGAVARAQQMVVVGDDKQLPPTRFFDVLADDDSDEADDCNPGDLDSVLALCKSRQVPEQMLRWHYRSRHQSLIAVSNHEFYDDRLLVIPSAVRGTSEGLVFHHVADGRFDRGQTATNRIEARQVAEAVMRHAREFPHVSLGVGTFSVSQRDAIRNELEVLRRASDGTEEFFKTAGGEPFFIKNLENIQGDEREVIFISVGYARDKAGSLTMNFGPLSNQGGERRLNVLISRARRRCEVFSSITAEEIDLSRAASEGAKVFKTFLKYAQTGVLDVAAAKKTGGQEEFERQVGQALVGQGYQVETRVGVSGLFVDLAIVDPKTPGRYLLGIECDGAQYRAARTARDRDRLRQQVLEDRGWTIHRIWSEDWFNRPVEQLAKVAAAVENAKQQLAAEEQKLAEAARQKAAQHQEAAKHPDAPQPAAAQTNETAGHTATAGHQAAPRPAQPEVIAREAAAPAEPPADRTVPYREADFSVGGAKSIPEMPLRTLMGLAVKVVDAEGPVHEEEVVRRLTTLCGAARAGNRISEAVKNALAEAADKRLIHIADHFCAPAGQSVVPVRNRESVRASGLKRPEMLPPAEIERAILLLVQDNLGVNRDEALVAASRMLGFKSTGQQLKEVLARDLDRLVGAGKIVVRNDCLYLAEAEQPAAVLPLGKSAKV